MIEEDICENPSDRQERSREDLPNVIGNDRFDPFADSLDWLPKNLTGLLRRGTLGRLVLHDDHANVLTIDVRKMVEDNCSIMNDDIIDLVHSRSLS